MSKFQFGFDEAAALGTGLSWAVSVIFMRLAAYHAGSVALNFFKTTGALLLFFVTLLFSGDPLVPELPLGAWIAIGVSGILGITFGDIFFVSALHRLGAGFEAIVTCLYAPFVLILSYSLFGETLNGWGLLGAALVVLAVLMGAKDPIAYQKDRREIIVGITFGILAELSMCVGILMIRDLYRVHSLLWIITFRFLVGNIVIFLWSIWKCKPGELRKVFFDPLLIKYMVPATLFGPFLSGLLWFLGFKYAPAAKVGVLNQLSSVFIIIFAALFLKEPLTTIRVLAITLAFAGAVLVGFN